MFSKQDNDNLKKDYVKAKFTAFIQVSKISSYSQVWGNRNEKFYFVQVDIPYKGQFVCLTTTPFCLSFFISSHGKRKE